MIDWVDADCKAWGRAQYWLLYGRNGWPSRNILDRMAKEGLVGASAGQYLQNYPEVLTGQNLVVANAVKRLAEEPRTLVTIHYVIRGNARYKCRVIHMATRTYYTKLDTIHWQLANYITELKRVAHISANTCGTLEVAAG